MKLQLLSFNEAYKIAQKIEPDAYEGDFIYGLSKDIIPWGKSIDVDFRMGETYKFNGFFVPKYCFKEDSEEIMVNILHYGNFIKIDFHYELDVTKIRPVITRLISYEGDIFYYKMFDDTGEVVECEKVGKADES